MLDQRELDLIGSRMSCYQFKPVIEKLARGEFNLDGLVTTFIEFSEIDRMFHYLNNPEPEVKKMVVLFDE
jgi:L-gulonate 5-dehydrogenase